MAPVYQIILVPICVMLSGLCAGLTLGFLSMDLTDLKVYIDSGTPAEKKYATSIYPIRKKGNQLLVTLLVGNTSMNVLLSILSADLFSGIVGFAVSTVSILYLGEIIPQAFCYKHGLRVGYHSVWLVRIMMLLTWPIAWPTAKLLSWAIGDDVELRYTRREIKSLVNIHGSANGAELTRDETTVLGSALDFWQKHVGHVMTPLERVFMIEVSTPLNFSSLSMIFQSGHSRIPVYETVRGNIVGVIFAKDLILLDPDDSVQAKTVMNLFNREVRSVPSDMSLGALLNEFKTGRGHLALVKSLVLVEGKDPFYETIGLVTLEDLIEELIGSEIVDETDVYEDNIRRKKVTRKRRFDPSFLTIFDSHARKPSLLSRNELDVVTSYLARHHPEFSSDIIVEPVLRKLLKHCEVVSYTEKDQLAQVVASASGHGGGAPDQAGDSFKDHGEEAKRPFPLIRRGEEVSDAILVVQGRLKLLIGDEGFGAEIGPWNLIGRPALTSDSFKADFSAQTLELPVRFVKISKRNYQNACRLTKAQRFRFDSQSSSSSDSEGDPSREGDDGFEYPESLKGSPLELIARNSMQFQDSVGEFITAPDSSDSPDTLV